MDVTTPYACGEWLDAVLDRCHDVGWLAVWQTIPSTRPGDNGARVLLEVHDERGVNLATYNGQTLEDAARAALDVRYIGTAPETKVGILVLKCEAAR